MRVIVLAVASFSALGFRQRKGATCGQKGVTAQIVNGEDAPECAWNWQVGLQESISSSSPFCGGMLISDQWVLTAAHCMGNPNFWVIAGEHKMRQISGNERFRKAAEVWSHPMYDRSTFDYDYAMVKLENPMPMTSCVGTICLPEGDDLTTESECWITGWGTLKAGGNQPNTLQEVQVGIISNEDCVTKFDYDRSQITERMICAQGKLANGSIADACQGDSGGPLVCRSGSTWTIHGATSWGRGCAGARYPGIWSRVHTVMDWIHGVMDGTMTTQPPPTCPSFATGPDGDGDCKCNDRKMCSTNPEGGSWNCPTHTYPGAWGGNFFQAGCKNCKCF